MSGELVEAFKLPQYVIYRPVLFSQKSVTQNTFEGHLSASDLASEDGGKAFGMASDCSKIWQPWL